MRTVSDSVLKWAGVIALVAYAIFLLSDMLANLAPGSWGPEDWGAAGNWAQALLSGAALIVLAMGYVHERRETRRLLTQSEAVFDESTIKVTIEDLNRRGGLYYCYRVRPVNTGGLATQVRFQVGTSRAANPFSPEPAAASARRILRRIGPHERGADLLYFGAQAQDSQPADLLMDGENDVTVDYVNFRGEAKQVRYGIDRGYQPASGSVFSLLALP